MWLFNKAGNNADSEDNTSGLKEVTHAERQRNRQIEWLREKVKGVTELERDKKYRAPFSINHTQVTLEITLPERFPFEAPVVVASPFFTHPWVDQQMVVVGSPLLKQFNIHCNLGDAIKEVIDQLTQNPPPQFVTMATQPMYLPQQPGHTPYPTGPTPSLLDTPYSFSSAGVNYVPSTGSVETPPQRSSSISSSPTPTATPSSVQVGPYTIPATLPGLTEKTDEQLNEYLKDEDAVVKIDRYISRLDVIKKIQEEMEELFAKNEEQSRENMQLEPDLQARWVILQEKYHELKSMQENFDKCYQKQNGLLERYNTKQVRHSLRTASQDADTNSEIIAEEFLDQKMDSTTFLQKFLHERKLHHLRSTKSEMLKYNRT